jgi:hypothetical protein
MSYFDDLSEYTYSRRHVRPGTRNVGWLGDSHAFETAVPDPELLEVLWDYCAISLAQMRGLHNCEFCPSGTSNLAESKGRTLLLGSAEIRVFSKHQDIYAAPNLIYHYVAVHHYKAPEKLLAALREMPRPPRNEYFDRLAELGLEWRETSALDAAPALFKYERCPNGSIVRK